MRSSKGFTLIEVMLTAALMSLAILGMIRVTQGLNRMGSSNQEKQLIENDAIIVLTRIMRNIKMAGDGLQGNILAIPDNPLAKTSPDIIFLSKDNAPVGTMGDEDFWTRYSTGTVDGKTGLIEEIYKAANWTSIKAGEAALIESKFIPMQNGVSIQALHFTFYDGQHPPQIANQSPSATSAIRAAVHFKSLHLEVVRELTVNLDALIYGVH